MSAKEENEELALSVIEALNTGDLSQWSQKLSDDYTAECPGVPTLNKVQSFGYNERFLIAFPDTRFEVHSVVAQGDQVFRPWPSRHSSYPRRLSPVGTARPATTSTALRDSDTRRSKATSKSCSPSRRQTMARVTT